MRDNSRMPACLSFSRASLCQYFLSLVVILLFCLIYEAAVNPNNGFLKPSFYGQWILAPRDVEAPGNNACHAAIFKKSLRLPSKSEWKLPILVKISASRAFQFHVNGHLISTPDDNDLSRNWKFARTFDISGALQTGDNDLDLVVANKSRVPALLVNGCAVLKSGRSLRFDTDSSWRVSSPLKSEWRPPGPIVALRDAYSGHLAASPISRQNSRFLRIASALTVYLLVGVAIILYRRHHWDPHQEDNPGNGPSQPASLGSSRPSRHISLAVLFAVLSVPMAIIREPNTGWDAQGHIDYVKYVAEGRGVPLGEQGSEMYQPPAYYFVAAAVYKCFLPFSIRVARQFKSPSADFLALKAVQLMTPALALFQILIVFKTLALFYKNRSSPSLGGAAFVALLPMQIYVSSFISNEVFSSLTISASLLLLLYIVIGRRYGIALSSALGAVLALACLSKYTGLLIAMTTCIIYGVFFLKRLVNRKTLLISFSLVFAIVTVLAGPFYYRNYRHYGRLFVVNQELFQCPSLDYRSLKFYIDPSLLGIGVLDKFVSRTVSFLDGNYSSMWLDNSHKSHHWSRLFEIAIYYLALFPTFLILVGFCRSFLSLRTDSEFSKACFPFMILTVLAIFTYVNYLLRISQYETVRAFYLLFQITPMVVFLEIGLRGIQHNSKQHSIWSWLMIFLYGVISLYYFLTPFAIGRGI